MLVLLAGGVAIAAIPDSGGTFRGCVNIASGVVRLLPNSLPAPYNDCITSSVIAANDLPPFMAEVAVSWNQQGPKGDIGLTGAQGPKGDTGLTGAQGLKGDTGLTGAQGLKGDTGLTGAQGPRGDTGLTGAQGLKGDTGLTGARGPKGDTGLTGAQGPQGVAGPPGPSGSGGGTAYTRSLNLSVTVGASTSVMSLTLPAGMYVAQAKFGVSNSNLSSGNITCILSSQQFIISEIDRTSVTVSASIGTTFNKVPGQATVSLLGVVSSTTAPVTLVVSCSSDNGAPFTVSGGTFVAMTAGTLTAI